MAFRSQLHTDSLILFLSSWAAITEAAALGHIEWLTFTLLNIFFTGTTDIRCSSHHWRNIGRHCAADHIKVVEFSENG